MYPPYPNMVAVKSMISSFHSPLPSDLVFSSLASPHIVLSRHRYRIASFRRSYIVSRVVLAPNCRVVFSCRSPSFPCFFRAFFRVIFRGFHYNVIISTQHDTTLLSQPIRRLSWLTSIPALPANGLVRCTQATRSLTEGVGVYETRKCVP
jgi:hypothetical protein